MHIYNDYPSKFLKTISEFNFKVLKIKELDLTSPYDIGLDALITLNIIKLNDKQSNKAFLLENYNFILEYNKTNTIHKRHKFKNKYISKLDSIKK